MLFKPELANDIFNNDHRTVDDESKVDRAKTHQISRDAEPCHSGQGKKKRERNRSCDDQGGTPVPEKKQQYRYDKHGSLEKIRRDRANRSVHQVLSVVFGADYDAAG